MKCAGIRSNVLRKEASQQGWGHIKKSAHWELIKLYSSNKNCFFFFPVKKTSVIWWLTPVSKSRPSHAWQLSEWSQVCITIFSYQSIKTSGLFILGTIEWLGARGMQVTLSGKICFPSKVPEFQWSSKTFPLYFFGWFAPCFWEKRRQNIEACTMNATKLNKSI